MPTYEQDEFFLEQEMKAVVEPNIDEAALQQILLTGDVSRLDPKQRIAYYEAMCKYLGLDPITRPFDFIQSEGKTKLYPNRSCAEQLRKVQRISITVLSRDFIPDRNVYIVCVKAANSSGVRDEAMGVVDVTGLKGKVLANALMRAETKAKRRVTFSIAGLGMTSEVEMDDVPDTFHLPEDYIDHDINKLEAEVTIDHPREQPAPSNTKAESMTPTEFVGRLVKLGYDHEIVPNFIEALLGEPIPLSELSQVQMHNLVQYGVRSSVLKDTSLDIPARIASIPELTSYDEEVTTVKRSKEILVAIVRHFSDINVPMEALEFSVVEDEDNGQAE